MTRSMVPNGLMLQAHLWRYLVTLEFKWCGWLPWADRLRHARWYSVGWLFVSATLIVMERRDARAGIQVQANGRAACLYLGTALKDYTL